MGSIRKRSPGLRQHFMMLALVFVAAVGWRSAGAAEGGTNIPAPALDLPQTPTSKLQTAVLAGGCFWGVQAVFQHVRGIESAVSGYSGGDQATAQYEAVGSGRTGHAESVKVTFDPRVITYGQILRIFFAVAHDPTQRDRQDPDVGTQYRSVIFSAVESQLSVARSYIAQLDEAHVYRAPRSIPISSAAVSAGAASSAFLMGSAARAPTRPLSACFRTRRTVSSR